MGFIIAICYYDGFVAREYKEKLKLYDIHLRRAGEVLTEKEYQLKELENYFMEYLKREEEKKKTNTI